MGLYVSVNTNLLIVRVSDHDKHDIECCKYSPEHQHPNCMNIRIPHDDPFYKYFKRQCLDFARIYAGPKPGCKLGKYETSIRLCTNK